MGFNPLLLYLAVENARKGERQRKLKDKERHDREKRIKTNKKRKYGAGE